MRRRGFTMVELLVVLSIVGVLAALLIPAIRASRATSHRVGCRDNQRNLTLAVANFTIRKGAFPFSTTTGPGRALNHSWAMQIMQDLDCNPYSSAYNFDVENYDPANRDVVGLTIRIFACPANWTSQIHLPSEEVRRADGTFYPAGSVFGRGHYGANWGGGRLPGFGDDFARVNGNRRGLMLPGPSAASPGTSGAVRPGDVTDGLAVTILLGEKRDGQGWAVGGYAGSEFDVGLSPQSPDRPGVRMVVSGSYHPGVVNFAFADGSVRAIRDAIDRKVWYALTTRDGGEGIEADAW
ncbi:DUF1559 family PulG-like putative transporter [Paludisphaera soli]|uniref:DUF1559 family PulG-like putative transporter n=1 Tax=Paludisphaera soli TaxID=2712865 RepID=UPI0013EE0FB4|nr:DUF1559 domain-containing protein [Paludisphaera soli]